MFYPEFFAILSDQCVRFAPGVRVPKAFVDVLTELRSTVALGDIDPDLLKALADTLPQIVVDSLGKAHDAASTALVSRLADLHQERADEDKKMQAKIALEQEAGLRHRKALEAVGEHQERIEKLEKLVAGLTAKK